MKETTKKICYLLICVAIVFVLIGIDYLWIQPSKDDYASQNSRTYECDYKTLSLFKTNIVTNIDGVEYSVTGNVLNLITDPLTLKDANGKTIGYAGDSYGFFTQDDHAIFVDDKFVVNMVGSFAIGIDTYTLKDENGDVVAKAIFNLFNTFGKITNSDGKVIATYFSAPFRNDFKITVYENDIINDDKALFMIMSSFVSDRKADSKNNSSSSKSKDK